MGFFIISLGLHFQLSIFIIAVYIKISDGKNIWKFDLVKQVTFYQWHAFFDNQVYSFFQLYIDTCLEELSGFYYLDNKLFWD